MRQSRLYLLTIADEDNIIFIVSELGTIPRPDPIVQVYLHYLYVFNVRHFSGALATLRFPVENCH